MLFESKIKVSFDKYDKLMEELINLEYENFVIEDPRDLDVIMDTLMIWDEIEETLKDDRENKEYVIVKIYTEEEDKLLKEKYGAIASEVKEEDWANNWKEFYKPFRVTEKIVIKPSWEEFDKKEDDIIVELDPGMAFGSGDHETTSMCIKLIDKYLTEDMSVIDVGCGSGILSIVASKLGAKNIFAVDLDEIAVKATNENLKLNKIENVEVAHGNLLEMTNKKADLVIANIVAQVIIMLNNDIKNHINDGGIYIMSGIINERLDEVLESLKDFNIIETQNDGDWNTIVVKVGE